MNSLSRTVSTVCVTTWNPTKLTTTQVTILSRPATSSSMAKNIARMAIT